MSVVERLPLHHMFVVHGYKGDARILERVVVTETREVQGKYIYRRRPIVVVGDSIPPQPQAYCALRVAAHLLAHSAQVTSILSAKLLPQKHLCGGPVLDTLVQQRIMKYQLLPVHIISCLVLGLLYEMRLVLGHRPHDLMW